MQSSNLSLHETMFLSANLQVANVARNSPRNEDHHIIDSRQGFSLSSEVGDGDILQQG
jgi:hypothetical protein